MLRVASAATLLCAARGAVVGLTADLEMWPQDSTYLNITATAADAVRRSGTGLRYSVAADITLMYETTRWNGSLHTQTPPRPYYQAIMEQVDEVLLMDYGQTTPNGLCQFDSARCDLAKPLWWTAPWIAYAESLRRISNGQRQVLVTMGLPTGANSQGTSRGWFSSEQQLEVFVNSMAEWATTSGFTTSGTTLRATGWQRGPFHKTAIFLAELYINVTKTRPCPVSVCPASAKRGIPWWHGIYKQWAVGISKHRRPNDLCSSFRGFACHGRISGVVWSTWCGRALPFPSEDPWMPDRIQFYDRAGTVDVCAGC